MRKGTLADFFAASPLVGSGIKIERPKSGDRPIDLEEKLANRAGGLDEDAGVADRGGAADPDGGRR
jgi:hypothetical protein